jgi:hypothetical protein
MLTRVQGLVLSVNCKWILGMIKQQEKREVVPKSLLETLTYSKLVQKQIYDELVRVVQVFQWRKMTTICTQLLEAEGSLMGDE